MKYAFLIYLDEVADAKKPQEVQGAELQEYMAYTQGLEQQGVLRGGEALHPTTAATTIRVSQGKVQPTDGPFAETKEQLAGFYLVECKDLDEAIQLAAKIPHASQGSIEIRPVVDFSQSASAS